MIPSVGVAPRARRNALAVLAPALAATACLSVPTPPGQLDDGGPDGDLIDAAGADARPAPPPALIGDLFYLPFEDGDTAEVLRDRSGAGRHAYAVSSTAAEGFHGGGRGFSGMQRAIMADDPALLPDALTLEAWVHSTGTGAQAIFSDHSMLGKGTWAELSFELTPVGGGFGLLFATNDCESVVTASAVEELVMRERWAHVAVTWDGAVLQFYVDGEPIAPIAFPFQPCDAGVPIMPLIGRRPLGDRGLEGRLDELKLSSRVKSPDEIRASMNFDPTVAYPSCGDGVAEEDEPCDSDDPCCAGCQLLPDGTACTGGRSCAAGRCTSGAPARTDDGLASLFEFSEGDPLADTAPGAPAEQLTLEGADAVVADGVLTVQAGSAAVASSTDHIASSCAESDEVSLEAWLEPLSLTQPEEDRPGRIITLSTSPSLRNITLGQDGRTFELRVRSAHSDFNGLPPTRTEDGLEAGSLTHVVATRAADGTRKIYVDGIRRDTSLVLGDLNWATGYPLRLGSEAGGERPWAGRYHLVAIYCRALSALEIADHVAVGSGD